MFACHIRSSAPTIARDLSTQLPGQWWAGGAVICQNRGGKLAYVVDWGALPAVKEARDVADRLGVETKGWSVGSVARKLLAWIGPAARRWRTSEARLMCDTYGYRRCLPGTYPGMALLDMKGAYYQALVRLISPRLMWLTDGPAWLRLLPNEQERWNQLLLAIASCKPLRNVLVGCMLGSDGVATCYCRGEPLPMRSRPGPFRTAALAIVRAVYELTYLQAEEAGAVYANTDSVVVLQDTRPVVWQAYGYDYRVRSEGQADVLCLDNYRVGEYQTSWYGRSLRSTVLAYQASPPSSITLTAWH